MYFSFLNGFGPCFKRFSDDLRSLRLNFGLKDSLLLVNTFSGFFQDLFTLFASLWFAFFLGLSFVGWHLLTRLFRLFCCSFGCFFNDFILFGPAYSPRFFKPYYLFPLSSSFSSFSPGVSNELNFWFWVIRFIFDGLFHSISEIKLLGLRWMVLFSFAAWSRDSFILTLRNFWSSEWLIRISMPFTLLFIFIFVHLQILFCDLSDLFIHFAFVFVFWLHFN